MSTALKTLTSNLAERFDLGQENSIELMDTLKATAFKVKDGVVTDPQMTALMIVAQQYGLNPWTKEIYAYPDKQNGIVPVVSVDGWSRIINGNDLLDGIEFRYSQETINHKDKIAHEWIECIITRKDRSKPIVVREYFDEVCRKLSFPTPWDTHPKRMHRHKALIQCARVAFGFGGIYDQDEAEGIIEINGSTGEILNKKSSENLAVNVVSEQSAQVQLPTPNDDDWKLLQDTWYQRIANKKRTPEQLIDFLEKSWTLTDKHKSEIADWGL